MRVSLSSFEEGRRVLCETAWLAGEPCQAAVVPRYSCKQSIGFHNHGEGLY